MTKRPTTQTGRPRLALALAMGSAPFLLWLSISLAMRLPVAHAADLTVCLEGPPDCSYTSIQAAVDAAMPGDVIKVAAGTYTGVNTYGGLSQVVYISKSVTIRGGYTTTYSFADPPDPVTNPTTLDAQGMGRGMVITGTIAPIVEGLHITGGDAYTLEGGQYRCDAGGGVYVYLATATISNCRVTDNTASSGTVGAGGGIFLYNSPSTLIGNTVTGNTASFVLDGWGGGMALFLSDATLKGNTVQNNIASTMGWGEGGGIHLEDSPAALIDNQVISNMASATYFGYGGGVFLWISDATLTGNAVINNTASSGSDGWGGGMALSFSDATLEGNTVKNNIASTAGWGEGGGIHLEDSSARLIDNQVFSNTASTAYAGYGGGIHIATIEGGGLPVTLEGNTVWNNVASTTDDGSGGGLYLVSSSATLINNLVVGNTATPGPAAIGGGGGVWMGSFWYDGSIITMTNNLVADNHASTAGSGLYFIGDQMGISGRLLHNTIADNTAMDGDSGQGVYVGQFTTLALSNTIIAGHTSVGITATDSSSMINLAGTLWHGNGLDAGGTGTIISSANVYGDPAFADPASWDYHLTASSAAIDVGVDTGVTTDFEDDPRPQGDGFDIGCDESPFTIQADVAIAKSVTPTIAAPNQAVTYTLTFTNTGPHPALGVFITDAVPTTLININYTHAGAAITPTGGLSYTWEVADLAPGQGGIITIMGMIPTSVSGVLELVNQAEITTTRDDSTPSNNVSTASNIIDAEPPTPPTLISPANGTLTNDDTPTLTWDASPSADVTGYLLNFDDSVTHVGNATSHPTGTLPDGSYTWTLAAYDILGNTSAYTDTWSFTVDTVVPIILGVMPADGATGVGPAAPLVITFSEPIDAGTFAYTVTPDPGGWSTSWGSGGTVVTLTHAPFAGDAIYTVNVTGARDAAGNSLAEAPYEWSFTTVAHKVYLPIVSRGYVVAPDLAVEHIVAIENDIQVVIRNQGNKTAVENFWVDVYIDPDPAPTQVNQPWPDLANQGLVWGVSADLAPGEVLTLIIDGDYYSAIYSDVTWPLAMGTQVYAQVDSYSFENTYGNVLEIDEIRGEPYNNIAHVTVPSGGSDTSPLPEPPTTGERLITPLADLPPRPKGHQTHLGERIDTTPA
jgi:uncharacterized repeat protein (TIGR01451 family)